MKMAKIAHHCDGSSIDTWHIYWKYDSEMLGPIINKQIHITELNFNIAASFRAVRLIHSALDAMHLIRIRFDQLI